MENAPKDTAHCLGPFGLCTAHGEGQTLAGATFEGEKTRVVRFGLAAFALKTL